MLEKLASKRNEVKRRQGERKKERPSKVWGAVGEECFYNEMANKMIPSPSSGNNNLVQERTDKTMLIVEVNLLGGL